MSKPSDLVQGTLDMLILKILALQPMNGWAISQRLKQISSEVLGVSDGSLYPALHKLEHRGWIRAQWKASENNRRAQFYSLTRLGEKQLERETANWNRLRGNLRHSKAQRGLNMGIEQWLYSFPLRLRSLFHPHQVDQELKEEIREHLEQQIEENVASGMSAEEARRAAVRSLGGITQIEQQCRDARGGNVVEDLVQDLRYGVRHLCRSPGFSALAILCLTLGIGANAAVFSWLEGILFRPYPAVAHQDRLYAVAATVQGQSHPDMLSWPDFLDLRRSCTSCEESFVTKITGSTLSIGDRAETATGSIVSANYFGAIGVRPILGRGFEPAEDVGKDSHPVVVISYQLWRRRFQGDPAIIGKMQRFNNVPHTIIGVAPEAIVDASAVHASGSGNIGRRLPPLEATGRSATARLLSVLTVFLLQHDAVA